MKQKLVVGGVLSMVLLVPWSVRAVETTPRVKTAAEIEAYKQRAREEKQNQIQVLREEQLQLKQQALEQYRNRLQQLKDQRKATVVNRINSQICSLNERVTSALLAQIGRMRQIVDRVEAKAKTAGVESEVADEVAAARSALEAAETAVSSQAGKECAITLTGNDATVGTEVRSAISSVESELKLVREKVSVAREAVRKAIVALAKARGEQISVVLQEGE